jgi:IPT/TIG domain
MSSFVLGPRHLMRTDRRRADRLRKGRRSRFGIEFLEDRITPATPTVTGLNPTFGATVGGTAVTISGTNFTGATVVDFGPNAATNLTVVSATTITADSPAGSGTVNVTVTTPSGTSPTNLADEFTYSPTIAAISPTSGPVGGGTTVTITGTSFTGTTVVDFGSIAATSFAVVNNTTITAVSPAGTGTVDITVTAPSGTSTTTPADRFTYAAAPVVSGIAPNSGSLAGGTLVTIIGSGFTGATVVDFGTVAGTNLTVVSNSSITVDSPPSLNTGTVDVTVTAPGGTSATSPADQFTYVVGPTVTAISPTFGPAVGGTMVTITGTDFDGATIVDFGTTQATGVTVVSDTSITAFSPAGSGTVNVTVTTPGGTSPTVLADEFTYSPTVTNVNPAGGPPAGGTTVTITGTSFAGASGVFFGGVAAASFSVVSSTTITAVSPPGTGTVDVTVTAPTGTSTPAAGDKFSYVVAPTVTGISPTSGSNSGGTSVTITGAGFTSTTEVFFGANPATSFNVSNDSTITAVSPAGTGTVDVTVVNLGGTSPTSAADQFTYVVVFAPTVTSVFPRSGPGTGGIGVIIAGTNLANATAVDFGTVAVPAADIISDTATQIIVVAPAPAVFGSVNVTVTTANGTSPTSAADLFFYASPGAVTPRVTAISPQFGPLAGGTLVTITGSGFEQTAPTGVYFGLTAATDVTVVSPTTITAVSPAGTGAVDVTVYTFGGGTLTNPADVFTYTTDGPQVTSVVRFGFHSQPTFLVVSFNMALDPASAQLASNYSVVGPNGHRFKVKAAVYNSTTHAVTLDFSQQLVLRKSYRFTINGTTSSGVKNSVGVLLDGANTGEPGSNFVTTITQDNLAGSAKQRPVAAAVRAKAERLVARVKLALRHKHV